MNKIITRFFILVILCIFLAVSADAFDESPGLIIYSPPDNSYTNNFSVIVTGKSEPDALLSINGNSIDNDNGNFSWNVSLSEGENSIDVLAEDSGGNTSNANLTITVDLIPPFIEITRPGLNETITSRYQGMEGRTENGSNVSVNGLQIPVKNGTFSTLLVLLGVDNVFNIESTDRAGNKAEKTLKVTLGTNIGSSNFILDFLNLTINFNPPGRFDGENDAVAGKYVSYIFNINDSTYSGYSINSTMWFNRITIKGFKPDNTSIIGPVARYMQAGEFGKQHSIDVEIHDNSMGTMLLDIRQFDDIYGKIRDYLMNRPRERLLINVSRERNVTLNSDESGNRVELFINESWKDWPEITYELADGVNASVITNGYSLKKDDHEAYLFKANYAGGSSDFIITGNELVAKVNNSLLIFRQFPEMNLTDADILDRLIAQAISDGIIGAEFFIDDIGSYDYVTYGDISLDVSFPDYSTLELNVSSTSKNGTVIAVGMSGNYFLNSLGKNFRIIYDGTVIHRANDYRDILDISNDMGHAEYMFAAGSNGNMILISIPNFSYHIISIKFDNFGFFGSIILGLLNFLSAFLFMFLPGTSWEIAFSIWWMAIVSMVYIVVRKRIRNR